MLVEHFVEQHDLAGDFAAAERLEFLESVDGDDIGGKAVRGGGGAAAQSGQHDLLRSSGNHAGILDQRSGFGSADPMWHGDRLEANLEAQLAKLGRNVFRRRMGLRRSAGSRSDIFRQVGDLSVGVVVIQRGCLYGGKLLQKQRREILLVGG